MLKKLIDKKESMQLQGKEGFTLIELVIVIAILAILAMIMVPAIGKYIDNANESKAQSNAKSFYTNAVLASETAAEGATPEEILVEALALSNIEATAEEAKASGYQMTTDPVTVTVVDGKFTIVFDGKDFTTTKE